MIYFMLTLIVQAVAAAAKQQAAQQRAAEVITQPLELKKIEAKIKNKEDDKSLVQRRRCLSI